MGALPPHRGDGAVGGQHAAQVRPLALGRAERGRRSPPHGPRGSAGRPRIFRSAGRTKTMNDTKDDTGLPGQREERNLVLTHHAEALGHARLHRDAVETDRAKGAERLLDRLVGSHGDAAAGDHDIGPQELRVELVEEPGRRRRHDPGPVPAPGLADGGDQGVAVGLPDLAGPGACRARRARPPWRSPRPAAGAVPAPGGGRPRPRTPSCAGPMAVPAGSTTSPACTSSPALRIGASPDRA